MSDRVVVERDGHVAWLVFDNEARRNAVTARMLEEGLDAVASLGDDPSVRVVVLRGAGESAFVAGADIATLTPEGEDPRMVELARALIALERPVLAALRGWCLGAGVLYALAADVRIAGDDVRLGIPAAKLGVTKVNIDTDGRLVWCAIHREFFRDHPQEFDLRGPGKPFMTAYAEFIAHKNQKLGSAGQLKDVRASLAVTA